MFKKVLTNYNFDCRLLARNFMGKVLVIWTKLDLTLPILKSIFERSLFDTNTDSLRYKHTNLLFKNLKISFLIMFCNIIFYLLDARHLEWKYDCFHLALTPEPAHMWLWQWHRCDLKILHKVSVSCLVI